jgi:hypothetical protein
MDRWWFFESASMNANAKISNQNNSEIVVEAFGVGANAVLRPPSLQRAIGENHVVVPKMIDPPPVKNPEATLSVKFLPGA